MVITRTSIMTGVTRSRELNVTQEQLDRLNGPEHIQDIMPHLPPEDREFILTGIIEDEWDLMFPDKD